MILTTQGNQMLKIVRVRACIRPFIRPCVRAFEICFCRGRNFIMCLQISIFLGENVYTLVLMSSSVKIRFVWTLT